MIPIGWILGARRNLGVVFSGDFEDETETADTIDITNLEKWTVESGTVDLVGFTFDPFTGEGKYLDLAGSGAAGTIHSSSIDFSFGRYKLSVRMAGTQRDPGTYGGTSPTVSTASITESILGSKDLERAWDDGISTDSWEFNVSGATTAKIVIDATEQTTAIGPILLEVTLEKLS